MSLLNERKLSSRILEEFNSISSDFFSFQENHQLKCIEKCGQCCFKPDIYCSPVELLPMALELLKRGEAQRVYDTCASSSSQHCILLEVESEEKYQGKCSQYQYRPLVCRTFGVSARHGKDKIDFSVCKPLKEKRASEYHHLLEKKFGREENLPFIDLSKSRLITLDPRFLEEELPISEALMRMLEKVLLWQSLDDSFA